jgi:hypothetical protein
MTSVYEQLKEASRLRRMRLGQEAPEDAEFLAHPEIRAKMVPLVEKEMEAGMIAAAKLDVPDNTAGYQVRDRVALCSDVWHSLREPDDLSKKVFGSVDAMVDELEGSEIDQLADQLTMLMDFSSPALDQISDEDLESLKKGLLTTEWSGLSGRQWAAIKLCLSAFSPQLLAANLSGSSSTDS